MVSEDEDMFGLSDDDFMPSVKSNPIQDNLFSELHKLQGRIDVTKNSIQEVKSSTEKIWNKFAYRAKYGEDVENNQGEWVTFQGEPIIEPHTEIMKCCQPLTVRDTHQFIIDNKWIILVALRNATNWQLSNLRFYVSLKNDKEIYGSSTFWNFENNSIWNATKLIERQTNLMATLTLDMPVFLENRIVEASGIILYESEGKHYQTVVPNFALTVENILDEKFTPQFEKNPEISVLALKAVSIEKTFSFNFQFSDASEQFMAFLTKYSFEDILGDIQIVRNCGSLKYCILEMLGISETEMTVRISTRDVSQLSIILSLLREVFPDVPRVEEKENCMEAANFLLQEIQLYLSNASQAEIQRAKINSDFYIP